MMVSQTIKSSVPAVVMVFDSWQVLYGKLRSAWICHSIGQFVSVILYNFHDNRTSGRSDLKKYFIIIIVIL